MQTRASILLAAVVTTATSAALVLQAPFVHAQLESRVSAVAVRLALAERTTIYGTLEVVDETKNTFSIVGVPARLSAPEPTDVAELEDHDVKVTLNTEGIVLSVIEIDEGMLEADDESMLDALPGIGAAEKTVIDGVLEVEEPATRVFRIAGLSVRYHAPKDVDLPALDNQKVRAEIDADGNVSGLALFPSTAGDSPEDAGRSQG